MMITSPPSLSATGSSVQEQLKYRKLVDAAQSFEASFMGELLKGANLSGKGDGSDEDDTMSSYGREALGKALSAAGGFGIARTVIARVEQQAHSLTSSDTGASIPGRALQPAR